MSIYETSSGETIKKMPFWNFYFENISSTETDIREVYAKDPNKHPTGYIILGLERLFIWGGELCACTFLINLKDHVVKLSIMQRDLSAISVILERFF